MIKYTFILIWISLLLVSCIGIEQVITVNNDNSGSISFTYRIAKEFSDLGSYSGVKKKLPLPLLRSDFERVIDGAKGLTLTGYSTEENDKDVVIRADIAFSSIDVLRRLDVSDDQSIQTMTIGKETSLTLVIPLIEDEKITDDTLAMVDELCSGYNIVFTIHTPKIIIEKSLGDVSTDKRSVTFTTTLSDLLRVKTKQLFTIKW